MGTSFVIPTTNVEFSGGVLAIRGLALADLGPLVSNYMAELVAVYMDTTMGDEEPAFDKIAHSLLNSTPQLAAELIGRAADVPERTKDIAKLPFPVQLEALQAVGQRTFESEDSLKKALEMVLNALQQASKAVDQAKVQAIKSAIGSTASEPTSAS